MIERVLKKPSISVCIVTKNNHLGLVTCLGSLAFQSVLPQEIVIVDNGSTDKTQLLVNNLKKIINCPIRLVNQKIAGRPAARNLAIKTAQGEYIVFTDDDCKVSFDWIEKIRQSITKNEPQVIVGYADTMEPLNPYSFSKQLFDSYRKQNSCLGKKIIDYEMFDTKNLVIEKYFFVKNKIWFNQKGFNKKVDGTEDCELGRIFETKGAGAKAFYDKSVIVFHKDSNNLISYLKKYWQSSLAFYFYRKIWPERELLTIKNKIKFRFFWRKRLKKFNCGKLQQLKIIFVIYLTVLFDYLQLAIIQLINFFIRFVGKRKVLIDR